MGRLARSIAIFTVLVLLISLLAGSKEQGALNVSVAPSTIFSYLFLALAVWYSLLIFTNRRLLKPSLAELLGRHEPLRLSPIAALLAGIIYIAIFQILLVKRPGGEYFANMTALGNFSTPRGIEQPQAVKEAVVWQRGLGQAFSAAFAHESLIFLASMALIVAVSVMMFLQSARLASRQIKTPEDTIKAQVKEAVRQAIKGLELGGDIRAAIMACYKRMCDILEDRGLPSREEQTPREFASVARKLLPLSEGSLWRLTYLFEEARYSAHDMGEVHRERAILSLRDIEEELTSRLAP